MTLEGPSSEEAVRSPGTNAASAGTYVDAGPAGPEGFVPTPENWRLIARAREARGDPEGARAALELAEKQR